MDESYRTEASHYLLALAKRNAQAYSALPATRAIILTGSAAEGISDHYSDIDMILYYDQLPSGETLLAASKQNQGEERRLFGAESQEACLEIYQVQGVECQLAHTTLAAWERDMATVLEQLDVTSPLQKALSGMLDAIPLYGEALIGQWQTLLAHYPDTLAQAMVEHNLAITPLWGIYDHVQSRDSTIWRTQLLVDTSYQLLGILAGLNRLYYSSFQFKRMQRFIAQMNVVPPQLAERLEALFHADGDAAGKLLEELVQEVVALVEQQMPAVNVTAIRKRLGWRQQAWKFDH